MNYYNPNQFYNPYYNQFNQQNQFQNQTPRQPIDQYQNQVQQPVYKPTGLQGKIVDNIDVVKATDIPLDYSVSYFPLADGSAIITKQLKQDGTSDIKVYRPVEENVKEELTKDYITKEELNKVLEEFDNKDILRDIKELKKQLKDMSRDLDDLKDKE